MGKRHSALYHWKRLQNNTSYLVHSTFSVPWIPTSQASAPRLSSTNKLPVAADPTRDFGLKVKKPKRMQGILGTGLYPTGTGTSQKLKSINQGKGYMLVTIPEPPKRKPANRWLIHQSCCCHKMGSFSLHVILMI